MLARRSPFVEPALDDPPALPQDVSMPMPPSRRRWKKPRRAQTADPTRLREEAAEVREMLAALEKVEKTASLYPPGSGVLRDFTEDLFLKLGRLLGKVQVLELAVGADEIEYEGEVVYDGTKSERSLAFALEDGGVRRLVFLEGLERGELAALVEALREARQPDAEDLVTLLWQRGLRHVGYVTVNFFSDPLTDRALEKLDLETVGKTLVDRLRARELSIDQVAMVRSSRAGAPAEEEGTEVYALSATESAEIQRRIADYAEESSAAPLAKVFLSLLAADSTEDVSRDRLAALQVTLGALLDEGDIAAASEVVTSVRRMADASALAASNTSAKLHANALRTFITNAAKKEVGAKLAQHLAKAREPDVRAVQEYVRATGKHAFFMASELLGCSPHDARIIAAIAETCRQDFAHLRDFTADQNPRVAAAAVRILSDVAGDGARAEFNRATTHKDAAVRREAFLALARCKDPRALDRLIEAFDDAEPEIRASALRAFCASLVRARPELYGRALMLVEDPRFEARPLSEQEQVYAILGRADPEKGVPFLERILARFALFHRERAHRRRLAVIGALGEIASQRAEEVLRRLAERTRNEEIRGTCRAALDRMELVRVTAETAPMDRSSVLRALESARPRRK
jgi:HEAT repeat protein